VSGTNSINGRVSVTFPCPRLWGQGRSRSTMCLRAIGSQLADQSGYLLLAISSRSWAPRISDTVDIRRYPRRIWRDRVTISGSQISWSERNVSKTSYSRCWQLRDYLFVITSFNNYDTSSPTSPRTESMRRRSDRLCRSVYSYRMRICCVFVRSANPSNCLRPTLRGLGDCESAYRAAS